MANDTGHADDIAPAVVYEARVPGRKSFLPWHKPRKQYVRHHQWRAEIDLMLNDAPRADNTLKYLGLPGPDLLDLRHLHAEICEPRDLGFRFLGFNNAAKPSSAAQTELNISLDEVNRLSRIDPQSEIVRRRL